VRASWILVLALLWFGAAQAQAVGQTDRVRERLRRLSLTERAQLARNLEELQNLSPRARAKLLERARVLRERERAFGRATGPETGAEARQGDEGLRAADRRWRAWLRERGREARSRLPATLLQRLETARPETRRRYFERVIEQQERFGRRVLAKARERAELAPEEARRLEGLPAREQLRGLREHYARRGP
jgi:hypothetical protein